MRPEKANRTVCASGNDGQPIHVNDQPQWGSGISGSCDLSESWRCCCLCTIFPPEIRISQRCLTIGETDSCFQNADLSTFSACPPARLAAAILSSWPAVHWQLDVTLKSGPTEVSRNVLPAEFVLIQQHGIDFHLCMSANAATVHRCLATVFITQPSCDSIFIDLCLQQTFKMR